MKGVLYAVGVGPGDPELLTLKAVRVLREADVIAVPKGREEGRSMALSIIEKAVPLNGKEIIELHFPMVKELSPEALQPQAERVLSLVREKKDVAFVTLGDPTLYSTFFHLYESILRIDGRIRAEIIPGVSSINASAARAGISLALAKEKVAILPAIYAKDLKDLLKGFETVVFMKPGSVLAELKNVLVEMGLFKNAVLVSKVGFSDEEVKPFSEVSETEASYFSTLIVRSSK
jgi:precorrin-2/cobalt-factor-2 C20-methyltransferase